MRHGEQVNPYPRADRRFESIYILQEKNLATRHVRRYLATNDRSRVRDNRSPSAKRARPLPPLRLLDRLDRQNSTRPTGYKTEEVGYTLKLSSN
jgi:hypothetical protein